MSAEMMEKVAEASRLTGLAQADVLRLCLAIGLTDLKRVGFDIAGVISEAARAQGMTVSDDAEFGSLKVAEGMEKNGTDDE